MLTSATGKEIHQPWRVYTMFLSFRVLLIACLTVAAGACTGSIESDDGTTISCFDTPDGIICSESDVPDGEDGDGHGADGEEGDGEEGDGEDHPVCEDTGCVTECTETDYGHRCVTECEGGLHCVRECEGEGDDHCSDLICECEGAGGEEGGGEEGGGEEGGGEEGGGEEGGGDEGGGDEGGGDEGGGGV
jgi:hypothetical protein